VDGYEWKSLCFVCFTPGDRNPGTHWLGDRIGLGVSLDVVAITKISFPCQVLNLGCSTHSLVTIVAEVSQVSQEVAGENFVRNFIMSSFSVILLV
jgi:hypothetical protein